MDETAPTDRAALFQELWVDLLSATGEGTLSAAGGCMLPSLAPGDRVAVEKLPVGDYRIGDVIVYRGSHSLVAHRLVGAFRAGGTSFVVHKGDNSSVRGVLPRGDILGRVTAVVGADGSRVPVVRAASSALRSGYYSTVAALRHRVHRLLTAGAAVPGGPGRTG